MRLKSEGECSFCNKTFSNTTITKHLLSCSERHKANSLEKRNDRIFMIKTSASPFWVYFEINAEEKLNKVDEFLRDLWLECCGHLSAFTINNIQYLSHPEAGDKSMNIPLKNILKQDLKFIHEYDFGTTTYLDLQCISERKGKIEDIEILAQNDLPDFKCDKCGKQAKEICQECIEMGEEGLLCEDCAKEHEHDEEMFLPVVNSPRMGVCGYTGDY